MPLSPRKYRFLYLLIAWILGWIVVLTLIDWMSLQTIAGVIAVGVLVGNEVTSTFGTKRDYVRWFAVMVALFVFISIWYSTSDWRLLV